MHDPDDTNVDKLATTLEEAARNQNSNLQRLIDAVGTLITASRDLMGRLQPGAGKRGQSANGELGGNDSDEGGA